METPKNTTIEAQTPIAGIPEDVIILKLEVPTLTSQMLGCLHEKFVPFEEPDDQLFEIIQRILPLIPSKMAKGRMENTEYMPILYLYDIDGKVKNLKEYSASKKSTEADKFLPRSANSSLKKNGYVLAKIK